MQRRSVLFMLAGLAGTLCSDAPGTGAPTREWAPKAFPISFWCGPPEGFITPEQYRLVAGAGFNYLMPPCDGPVTPEVNRKILANAQAVGLKAFLSDPRLPTAIGGKAEARQAIDAVTTDYAKHPALAGYFLGDEPGAGAFRGLGETVAYLRQKDPVHPTYLNLLPNYATPEQLGAPSYDAYVGQFIQTVQPFVVSYDHYALLKTGDRPEFFKNLEIVRKRSLAAGLPFWQIILDTQHGGYRAPTEAEKRWQAMQTLAYGASGLMWFTYWTPNDPSFVWGPGLVDRQGKPTPQYAEVRRINADIRTLGKYLLSATSAAVFRNARTGIPRQPGSAVSFPGGGEVTVGLFRQTAETDHDTYALFANLNYRQTTTVDVDLNIGRHKPQRLNKASDNWLAARGSLTVDGDYRVQLQLAPGDAELFRW